MSEEEFRSYYALLAGKIYAYAVAQLHSDSAQDVVSDTFEVVWRKAAQAPSDPDACRAWIFTIAKFKLKQEHQRMQRKHHDNRFAEDYPPRQTTLRDVAEAVADADLGAAAYLSLTDSERELFALMFILEVSRSEAQQILGISEGALNTRISRLRSRLDTLEKALTDDETTMGGQHERD